MKRLFTFGCSFTNYAWPTWADLFGLEFDHAENWGVAGIGNIGIVQRIAECHSKNNFTKDDLIIVQWSSHLRNDYHRFRSPPRGRDSLGWKTKGSVFNYINKEIYDKNWIVQFFDEKSFIMYSLNAIQLATGLLESTGANFLMTTIGNFEKLGSDMFEAGGYGEVKLKDANLWNDYPEFIHYKSLFETDNWLEPIGLFSWQREDALYKWQGSGDPEPWTDPHPSTKLHMEWINEVVKEKLNLSKIPNATQCLWIDETENLKYNTNDLNRYGDELLYKLPGWNNSYRGY